jgi:hypothetical protein
MNNRVITLALGLAAATLLLGAGVTSHAQVSHAGMAQSLNTHSYAAQATGTVTTTATITATVG